MKKLLSLILSAAMICSLSACAVTETASLESQDTSVDSVSVSEESTAALSDTDESDQDPAEAEAETGTSEVEETDENESSSSDEVNGSNILVAYYSWADNAILSEDVDAVTSPSVLAPGNVEQLAGWVQEETGGDLFSIRVTEPYPSGWDECLERANQERGDDARPELVENVEDLSQYDTIFIGYPNWWYGVPMALLTFLESNDFSGKQIYLFCSHGTGGLANSVNIITEAIPGASISDNIFDCYEEEAASSREAVQSWVAGLGLSGGALVNAENTEEESAVQENVIYLQIGDTELTADLADNSSAEALAGLLNEGPLTLELQDYGNMEKVGPIGTELPRNDEQITTEPGDIILYQGDSLVIYYAPNSWNFTRLGKIRDIEEGALRELLGDGNVTVTLSLTQR